MILVVIRWSRSKLLEPIFVPVRPRCSCFYKSFFLVHMPFPAIIHTHTFTPESTQSFINETPGLSVCSAFVRIGRFSCVVSSHSLNVRGRSTPPVTSRGPELHRKRKTANSGYIYVNKIEALLWDPSPIPLCNTE